MSFSKPVRVVLVVVTLGLLALPALPAAVQSGPPLTREQVTCDGQRIYGLALRSSMSHPADAPPTTAFLAAVAPEMISVLMVQNPWNPRWFDMPMTPVPEQHLGATLSYEVRPYLLNPERPELFQVSMARVDSASTLVDDPFPLKPPFPEITFTVHPANGGGPRASLSVNNLAVPEVGEPYNGAELGGARPGRLLRFEGAVGCCEPPIVSATDRHTLTLLSRMVRVRERLFPPFDGGNGDMFVGLYRGEEPDHYRIDPYEIDGGSPAGPYALELEVERDPVTGALVRGLLRKAENLVEGPFTGLGESQLFFHPPVLPGVETWSVDDPEVVQVAIGFEGLAPGEEVEIDLAGLLDETVWNP